MKLVGSSGGNMPMNPVPKRVPVITVVGDPIMCPLIPDPTHADIDKVLVTVWIENILFCCKALSMTCDCNYAGSNIVCGKAERDFRTIC